MLTIGQIYIDFYYLSTYFLFNCHRYVLLSLHLTTTCTLDTYDKLDNEVFVLKLVMRIEMLFWELCKSNIRSSSSNSAKPLNRQILYLEPIVLKRLPYWFCHGDATSDDFDVEWIEKFIHLVRRVYLTGNLCLCLFGLREKWIVSIFYIWLILVDAVKVREYKILLDLEINISIYYSIKCICLFNINAYFINFSMNVDAFVVVECTKWLLVLFHFFSLEIFEINKIEDENDK